MDNKILVTGAFDMLHAGHLHILKTAKALAEACGGLVVCMVNTDAMIKRAKGPLRPQQPLDMRIEMLQALKYVDQVLPVDKEERIFWYCKDTKPIRLVGTDYVGKSVTGAEHCRAVLFVERTNDSTTQKIEDTIAG